MIVIIITYKVKIGTLKLRAVLSGVEYFITHPLKINAKIILHYIGIVTQLLTFVAANYPLRVAQY